MGSLNRILLNAAHIEDRVALKRLLREGAELDTNSSGLTALMYTVKYNQIRMLRLLLDAGIDTETADSNGMTSLMLAAQYGHLKALRILLHAHANVEAQGTTGKTALITAVEEGKTEIIRQLLDANANTEVKTHRGNTALLIAVRLENIDIIRILLAAGAKTGTHNLSGSTALILSVECTNTEVMKILLAAGAKTEARDKQGLTALMFAVIAGKKEVIRMLLKAGADKKASLQYAYDCEDEDMISLLENFGTFQGRLDDIGYKKKDYDRFICSVSMKIMDDPVFLSTGRVYERKSLEAWFKKCEGTGTITCPDTRQEVSREELNNCTAFAFRECIEHFVVLQEALAREQHSNNMHGLFATSNHFPKSQQNRGVAINSIAPSDNSIFRHSEYT